MLYLLYLIITILLLLALYLVRKGGKILFQIIRGYGVPNVTSHQKIWDALIKELSLKTWDVFLDLWAGEGKIVAQVQQAFPGANCIGIEYAPEAYTLALKYKETSWWTYTLLKENIFSAHLSCAMHLYCYLMPHLMEKLWAKVSTKAKPWTLLYVNAFPIKSQTPLKHIIIESSEKFVKQLFVYEV